MKTKLVFLLTFVSLAGASLSLRQDPACDSLEGPAVSAPHATLTAAAVRGVEVPAVAPADDRAAHVAMPDGTWLPALNGVTGAPKSAWSAERPYAPVLRVDRLQDADWYVHADGSWTTTRWFFRKDLGREEAQSYALHPRPDFGTPQGFDTADGATSSVR